MMRQGQKHISRGAVILAAALACALVLAAPAEAQLFRGRSDDSELRVRIDQLEAQIRTLTGQVEQYGHRIRQLEQALQRFQEDAEYRFQELGSEGTGAGRSGAPMTSAPVPPTPIPQAAIPQPQGPGQPSTYGGIRPLAPPPGAGQPSGAAPLDISPPSRGGTAAPAPGQGGTSGSAAAALSAPSDPQSAYDVAYAFVLQRDYESARDAFSDFLDRYPSHALAPNAQYWLGESYYAQGQYHEAADAFLKVYRQHQSSDKAPDSLLKLAMSLQALGEKEAACASYAELSRTFPDAPSDLKKRAQAEQKGAGC